MKKLLLLFTCLSLTLVNCSDDSVSNSDCGKYIKGKNGGCYYINSNGNKTYVDRSYCNC